MITTKNKYSSSVNIVRDVDVTLNYIPTHNSKKIFNQIISDYSIGTRAFNIIGAYGTGKSSFLWAFEKNINNKTNYFAPLNNLLGDLKEFKFITIIGEYQSIIETFAKKAGLKSKDYTVDDILEQIDVTYNILKKEKKGIVIVIDEFGKFLEFASKNNPERELYFIQQLSEYVNDLHKDIFLITTLHQDFNGYSHNLTKSQKNEWDKVKGRLKEITFNEPVEQLLFLAAERFSQLNIGSKDKNFTKLFKAISNSKAFPLRDYFNEEIAEKLLPFDILASSVLTLSLQKYGQNERSLFTFIESHDLFGLRNYDTSNNPYFNISNVYDYLSHNYYSFLSSKSNPHYAQWAAIRIGLEKTEGVLENDYFEAEKIIKTIGLLNIFASGSAKIDKEFLIEYGKYSLGIKNPDSIIFSLEKYKIIKFVKHSNKFILFEGTDLDIELAIDEAGNLVERITNSNVVHYLNRYFDFPYISAKAIYYIKGTPRYFQFRLSEEPINVTPEGEIDGFINLIFSDRIQEESIEKASENCSEAILYGWYKNTNEISSLIHEIEKIKKVKELHSSDKVAVRELDSILQHQIRLLNHYVMDGLYSKDSSIIWYFGGRRQTIQNRKNFNRILSEICAKVYPNVPAYKNEMVNKTKLSPQISTARRELMKAMLENWDKKDFSFSEDKFPPEKTIYLSLLRETGIHNGTKNGFIFNKPNDESFLALWNISEQFINSTKSGKRDLTELIDILSSKPFKLKGGFIDFWLPIFLFIKKEDFALFNDDIFIPNLSEETLELIAKNPKDYEIKAFNIEGVRLELFNKYRTILNQSHNVKPSSNSFIETIKPFLVFYKGLPLYAKQTKRMTKRSLAIRETIALSKEPEKTFFEDFPKSLNFNINLSKNSQTEIETYVNQLQEGIREIRTCYDELVNRLELFIINELLGETIRFPEYKDRLQTRYKKIKKHLLLPHQKVFIQRLFSELDDRTAWLNSMAHACLNKSLETITDEEEKVLYDKFKDIVYELDNLTEINSSDIDVEKEEVFKLEITSFVEGIKKNLIRLPKNKTKEISKLSSDLSSKLTGDRQINIATLTKLLQEQLRNG